jgi:hypothetical protein
MKSIDGADGPAAAATPRVGKFLGRLLRPGTNPQAAPEAPADVVESSPRNGGGGASTVVVLVSLLCVWILAWMAALQVLGISEFVVKPAAPVVATTDGCPTKGGGGGAASRGATKNIWVPGWLRPYWDAALMATLFGLVWVAIVVALIVLLEKLVGQQLLMKSPWSNILVIPVALLACIPTIVFQASGAVDMDKNVSPNLFYAPPLLCVMLTLLLNVVYM